MHAVTFLPRLDLRCIGLSLAIIGSLADARALAETAANPTPGDIVVAPRRSRLNGRRATQQMIATNRGPDGALSDATRSVQWLVRDPEDRDGLLQGSRRALAERDDDASSRGSAAPSSKPTSGRGHGAARTGELPPRRDPGVQPGRVQHGRLPWHADRQGGLPAEPARLPARPGLHDPLARGRRPSDQSDGRRRPA